MDKMIGKVMNLEEYLELESKILDKDSEDGNILNSLESGNPDILLIVSSEGEGTKGLVKNPYGEGYFWSIYSTGVFITYQENMEWIEEIVKEDVR